MGMKPVVRARVTEEVPSISKSSDLSALKEKTGIVSRMRTKLATSRAAGEALRNIERERIREQASVELTAIKVASTAIRAAILGNAMPTIGALTTRLNAATAAVDQALTMGNSAEVATHMFNRTRNLATVDELQRDGKITGEESDAMKSFAHEDAYEDIKSSRHREAAAKQAVATLYDCALKNLTETQQIL